MKSNVASACQTSSTSPIAANFRSEPPDRVNVIIPLYLPGRPSITGVRHCGCKLWATPYGVNENNGACFATYPPKRVNFVNSDRDSSGPRLVDDRAISLAITGPVRLRCKPNSCTLLGIFLNRPFRGTRAEIRPTSQRDIVRIVPPVRVPRGVIDITEII